MAQSELMHLCKCAAHTKTPQNQHMHMSYISQKCVKIRPLFFY